MEKFQKYQNGLMQLPIVILIMGIIVLSGIGYAVLKFQQKNQNDQIDTNTQEYITEVQNPALIPCPQWEDAVPSNNLPEGIAYAIVQKYFYGSGFLDAQLPRDVDQNTFVILPKSYVPIEKSDKYWGELYLPNGEGILLTSGYYAKDKNHVYAKGKILPEADPATFNFAGEDVYAPLATPYTRDKNYIWVNEKIINKADSCTFAVLSSRWAKDKNQVYNHYYDTHGQSQFSVVDANPVTLRTVVGDDRFAQDNTHVFRFDGHILAGVDSATFVVLSKDFEKSDTRVFYEGEVIADADAATFVAVGDSAFFKDSRRLYFINGNGEVGFTLHTLSPAGMDIPTFKQIYGEYFKDTHSVYIGGIYEGFTQIKNADPFTFEILFNICRGGEKSFAYYAKDKNYVYCDTTVMDADPSTFEYIGQYDDNPGGLPSFSGVGKDKNCTYKRDKKLLDSQGGCITPASCTAGSLASNPSSCGIN